MQRVLITGARGLLGTPTARMFAALEGVNVLAAGHGELDITNHNDVRSCLEVFRPDLVINCAAFTKVDACESESDRAERVNGHGAGIVAEAAAAVNARLIHISTDYVFDGASTQPYRAEAPPAPAELLCAYGRSKLLGERLVQTKHPSPLIVRTAWVYGEDGPCFPRTILRLAAERPELRVVSDQTGSPTYAADLAGALVALAQRGATGIVHVTNGGQCTWYEFACEIVRLAGMTTKVIPIATEEYPLPARRPKYSVLDNQKYVEIAGAPLRSRREAIAAFMRSA